MTRTDGAWRGRVLAGLAGAGLTAGMVLGSTGTVHADPSATPAPSTTAAQAPASAQAPTSTPKPTVAVEGGAAAGASTTATASAGSGDVLDQLAEEYAVGAGGGQVSNLLKTTLKLRAMGFRPSKAILQEIAAAMNYRPNQMPLISALKDTIAYQQKLKAQMEVLQQYQQQQANGAVMGAGQMPADSNPAGLPGASLPGTAAAPGAPMVPAPTP